MSGTPLRPQLGAVGYIYAALVLPLVCIDVDGTLVGPSGEPTDAVWAATAAAVRRGQHLALCTARGAFGKSWDYAVRLDPTGWHIFHAGASLLHAGTGEERNLSLTDDQVAGCAAVAASNDWVAEFYETRQYVVDSDHQSAIAHAALMGVPFERRPLTDLTGEIVRVQLIVPVERSADALAAAPEGTQATSATSPIQPGVAFVSITKAGANKGTAIERLATEIGTTAAQTMMIGDGHNDVLALEAVGYPVAMGNADEHALAVSDHVVADVENDGVVEALALSLEL